MPSPPAPRSNEATNRGGLLGSGVRKAMNRRILRQTLVLALVALACGSGSKGGDKDAKDPGSELTRREQSARFLAHATLGANMEEIERVEALGLEAWIDEQMAIPASHHFDAMRRLQTAYGDPALDLTSGSVFFRRFAWWDRVMKAPDLLRQRVALALSEIFVISDGMDILSINPDTVASYYDMLLDGAFGSYEDLLLGATLHPGMGVYLSHLNNDRSNANLGRFPDENYAREVMQLFSIGLFELDADGSQLQDDDGNLIPTYSNGQITEFAKVFTGLGLQGPGAFFGSYAGDRALPMVMYEAHHEPGPKILLDGYTIASGQSGMEDIEEAIALLANHPNVGPFIALRLIQRLVKSNPSPKYIEDVARVFADDGAGVRGNLGAVVREILLNKEARRDPRKDDDGHLREPFLRWVSLLRTFDASSTSGEYLIDGNPVGFLLLQHPMTSPSVFNFFQPDFAPNGSVKEAGLVAPEFQITTDSSVIWAANLSTFFSVDIQFFTPPIAFFRAGSIDAADLPVSIDLSDEEALNGDIDALLDRLDLLLTYGTLSEESRGAIRQVLDDPAIDPSLRARTALHLILISPDYAVID